MRDVFEGKHVCITGGTGSFGTFAIPRLIKSGAACITIYSRDEYKQSVLQREYKGECSLRFIIGDVRDVNRLEEALDGVDIVIHAAALKQVGACEANPSEAVQTNVNGAHNVIRAARRAGVSCAINLSADKACSAEGVYGATKMLSERIFTSSCTESGSSLRAASIRYSNVLGSRGSVVSVYRDALNSNNPLMVFDPKMVRLVLTQTEVLDLVVFAIRNIKGGEIFIKESPAMLIEDLARVMVDTNGRGEVIVTDQSAQAGEKYDASLFSAQEARRTIELSDGYFVIIPDSIKKEKYAEQYGNIVGFASTAYSTTTARVLKRSEVKDLLMSVNDENLKLQEVSV